MYEPVLAWLITPFWADSAKCNFDRRVIFGFSLRKSQRLRQTEAHCSKKWISTDITHSVSAQQRAEQKSSDCRDTALAKTPLASSPQACHSLVLEQHQRVIGSLGSPVRLTSNQAWGSMAAFTPKAATQDWFAHAKRDRWTHSNTMELPIQTGTGNVTQRQGQVKVWATWHSGNKRRKLAQCHNASSGTANTDGTQMKDSSPP